MRVLLDESLPRRLARLIPGHDVRTVQRMGWAGLRNGPLLRLESLRALLPDLLTALRTVVPGQLLHISA